MHVIFSFSYRPPVLPTPVLSASRGGFRPTWFMLLVGLQPELLPVMEVTRLHELCPLVLIFGRKVTRLKVCGAEMRRGRIFTMPPCVQWLDGCRFVCWAWAGHLGAMRRPAPSAADAAA